MTKRIDTSVYDGALDVIKNNATTLILCTVDPVNYAGLAAVTLATKTGLGPSSFTGPASETGGRKLTVNAVPGIIPSANGTATHQALTDGVSTLLAVTEMTSQALLTTDTWTNPAYDIHLVDPQ